MNIEQVMTLGPKCCSVDDRVEVAAEIIRRIVSRPIDAWSCPSRTRAAHALAFSSRPFSHIGEMFLMRHSERHIVLPSAEGNRSHSCESNRQPNCL